MSRAQDDRQSIEKPLDRLNYYNGQRLEARDLKLEQAYHMRVRRWLNKSLYADGGIVNGLELIEQEGTPAVVVTAGLALDTQGREIILLEDTKVDLPPIALVVEDGQKAAYLTIRYDEHTTGYEQEGCTARSEAGAGAAGSSLAWGGPALMRAEPVFAWREAVPPSGSDEIALARVVLTADCKVVENVDLSVQDLVDKPGDTVRQFALEGFRDIDADNPQRVYFHIRGRQPTAVTLYLRAERFSPLYYTELVEHTHSLEGDIGFQDHDEHVHLLTGVVVSASDSSKHEHTINMMVSSPATVGWLPDRPGSSVFSNQVPVAFETQKLLNDKNSHRIIQGNKKVDIEVDGDPNATHERYPILAFTGEMTIPPGYEGWTDEDSDWDGWDYAGRSYEQDREDDGGHTHEFLYDPIEKKHPATGSERSPLSHTRTGDSLSPQPVGVRGQEKPREGQQLNYVNHLQVWVDGVNLTTAILTQIQSANPAEHWNNVLGDGTKDHPLVVPHDEPPRRRDGTGPIRLDFLPNTNFSEGEHYIEFSVEKLPDENGKDPGNGGRIYYNLYVE